MYSFILSFIHPSIQSSIHVSIHPSIHSFVHSFIHSFIHSSIHQPSTEPRSGTPSTPLSGLDSLPLGPNPKLTPIHSPSVCTFSWRVRHIRGRPKPSSSECKWTIKPLSSESALVQAYGSPSRKCNRKIGNNMQMKVLFFYIVQ